LGRPDFPRKGHGVDAVQEIVATLRTCAHLWAGDDDRTRSIIDAVLAFLRTGCGLTRSLTAFVQVRAL
jgi:hypothetical protein